MLFFKLWVKEKFKILLPLLTGFSENWLHGYVVRSSLIVLTSSRELKVATVTIHLIFSSFLTPLVLSLPCCSYPNKIFRISLLTTNINYFTIRFLAYICKKNYLFLYKNIQLKGDFVVKIFTKLFVKLLNLENLQLRHLFNSYLFGLSLLNFNNISLCTSLVIG